MRRARFIAAAFAFVLFSAAQRAGADPVAYDAFVKGAEAQRGLFTVWHKDGKIYLELAPSQLEHDFVQTIVPASGLGGQGLVWGNTDHLPVELLRFERAGNTVALIWPNPSFVAPGAPAATLALARSFPRSIVALAPIAALDEKSGDVVIDAAPFLDDQLDLHGLLKDATHASGEDAYTLDRERSYFGGVKAFPKNVVIEALQAWTSPAQRLNDVPADPRNVQIRVVYNIADPPTAGDGYVPRFADDRVGFYDDVYLQFADDRVVSRELRYIVRWNIQPSDPSKPLSPAAHPVVFYMSDTIPQKYRGAVRSGVLAWNAAFERIGISGAFDVRDQPSDPNWDPDDIRYNVLRWVPEFRASFGADSQTLYDPRTGEQFRSGVLISADEPLGAFANWTYFVDPVRYGRSTDPMPQKFLDDELIATMLHETGHNMGLQHNFIGSMAYTAKQLQDPSFTAKNGLASTVMEYVPLNLWPRSYPQGDYDAIALGPYDYYAIHWGYARVPGANTPAEELPTLQRWAAAWSDPRYRYASDEDVAWGEGHAADPRVNQDDLTDDPLGWCDVQMKMLRDVMGRLNTLFPQPGEAYDAERRAFGVLLREYGTCATLPAHFIGGQYLSRAHRGDPHAEPPIVPVPRNVQRRAFELLAGALFAAEPWHFSPELLNKLGYSEWAGYGYGLAQGPYGGLPAWAYQPPARHDLPLGEQVAALQKTALDQMFAPLVLARLAAGPSESLERTPMRELDLFAWMRASIFREIAASPPPATIEPERRELQLLYAAKLGSLLTSTDPAMPEEARALARAELAALESACTRALHSTALDPLTRAHLEWLRTRARDALSAPKH